MTQKSLSLFEAPSERTAERIEPVIEPVAAAVGAAPGGCDAAGTRERQQRHLIAARRLSRRIARLPDHSPAQLQAGRMICRHLVAMLKEAEAESEPTAH